MGATSAKFDPATAAVLTEDEAKTFQAPLFQISPTAQQTIWMISAAAVTMMSIWLAAFYVCRPLFPRAYLARQYAKEIVMDPTKWFRNMFSVTAEEAFEAGISMDGCMHIHAWTFAFRVSVWLLCLMPLPLFINWYGAGFPCPEDMANDIPGSYYKIKDDGGQIIKQVNCGPGVDEVGNPVSLFMRLSFASFQRGNSSSWGHVVTYWIVTFVVLMELKRAGATFTKMRFQWLLQRKGPVARSLMAVNVTARTDKEFRKFFEDLFPGKVVDAKLVKFCKPLAKTCRKLEAAEKKLEDFLYLMKLKNEDQVPPATPSSRSSDELHQRNEEKREKLEATVEELRRTQRDQQRQVLLSCEMRTQEVENETAGGNATGTHLANMSTTLLNRLRGPKDSLFSSIGFVTFTDVRTTTLASQVSFSTLHSEWQLTTGPDPSDVLWYEICTRARSANQKLTYVMAVGAFIIFLFWSTAIGFCTEFVDLDTWREKFGNDKVNAFFWNQKWLIGFIEGLSKSIVLITALAMLPKLLYQLMVTSGRMVKSVALVEIQVYLVIFQMVFVIYVTSIAKPLNTLARSLMDGDVTLDFDVRSMFGTAVPSEFPTIYSYGSKFLFNFPSALFQVFLFTVYFFYRLFGRPSEYAWTMARRRSSSDIVHLRRFVMLTMTCVIVLMTYNTMPFSALLFFATTFVARFVLRYSVLYVDPELVDGGGLHWVKFEGHLLIVLVLVLLTACMVLTSLDNKFGACALIPLLVSCFGFHQDLRRRKWQFLRLQDTSDANCDDENDDSFPYIQPQLCGIKEEKEDNNSYSDDKMADVVVDVTSIDSQSTTELSAIPRRAQSEVLKKSDVPNDMRETKSVEMMNERKHKSSRSSSMATIGASAYSWMRVGKGLSLMKAGIQLDKMLPSD